MAWAAGSSLTVGRPKDGCSSGCVLYRLIDRFISTLRDILCDIPAADCPVRSSSAQSPETVILRQLHLTPQLICVQIKEVYMMVTSCECTLCMCCHHIKVSQPLRCTSCALRIAHAWQFISALLKGQASCPAAANSECMTKCACRHARF